MVELWGSLLAPHSREHFNIHEGKIYEPSVFYCRIPVVCSTFPGHKLGALP
jgi:hypothetical protein